MRMPDLSVVPTDIVAIYRDMRRVADDNLQFADWLYLEEQHFSSINHTLTAERNPVSFLNWLREKYKKQTST